MWSPVHHCWRSQQRHSHDSWMGDGKGLWNCCWHSRTQEKMKSTFYTKAALKKKKKFWILQRLAVNQPVNHLVVWHTEKFKQQRDILKYIQPVYAVFNKEEVCAVCVKESVTANLFRGEETRGTGESNEKNLPVHTCYVINSHTQILHLKSLMRSCTN